MIRQVFVYECDYCGHTESETVQHGLGPFAHLLTHVPMGWHVVSYNKLACPNHVIVVKTVKGEE